MISPLNLIIKPNTVYRFAELLSKPYNQYDAYRKGLINEQGRFLNRGGDLDGLEYIALRIKKLFEELLPGQNKFYLSSLAGTLKIFNEDFAHMGINRSDVNVAVEKFIFEQTNGELSYLDYLIEEAQVRYITEDTGMGMMAGAEGGLASATSNTFAGGIASYDRPMAFGKKKKKKGPKDMVRRDLPQITVVEQATEPAAPPSPYMTLQVDPIDYEEIARSTTPSGEFDVEQLTKPALKKYFKRLGERSSNKQVFVIGNNQQPPYMLRMPVKKKKA
jgi:hypothetical protein